MTRNVTGRVSGWALLAIVTCAGAAPATAQGVTYVTVTKPEMGGAMGMVARMAPGAMEEGRETTFIQLPFSRVDDGEERSTILDLSNRAFTFLDHGEKTYYTLTFDDMLAQAQAVGGVPAAEGGDVPELKVERTGKTRSFDGYSAEQVLLIFDAPVGGDAAQPGDEPGMTTAFLTELWISRDFPGYDEYRKAQEAMAAGALSGAGAGMAAAMMGDPAMSEAASRMAEEMKGLDGVPVRTVTSFVMVPPGADFDRDAVLAASDKPLESVSVAGMAAEGARGAARQALGGMMGRRRQQEQPAPEAAAAPPAQTITMRIIQEVKEIRVGAIPADRFQVPAGYREAPPMP